MPDAIHDALHVSVRHTKEVAADGADLSVTIKGVSLLTGQMALHRAREVAHFVADLAGIGIGQEDIFLQGVSADTTSGTLVKTSGASYRLRIYVAPLEKLADVLGTITSQKNATLNGIAWRYPEDAGGQDAWLVECIAEASAKAARIAAALGVHLLGIHLFTEKYIDPSEGAQLAFAAGAAEVGMRRARVSPEELGLEVTHTKIVTLQVNVQYRVSSFDEAHG